MLITLHAQTCCCCSWFAIIVALLYMFWHVVLLCTCLLHEIEPCPNHNLFYSIHSTPTRWCEWWGACNTSFAIALSCFWISVCVLAFFHKLCSSFAMSVEAFWQGWQNCHDGLHIALLRGTSWFWNSVAHFFLFFLGELIWTSSQGHVPTILQ